jgi:hypothetical protein
MPAKWFRCPSGKIIEIEKCLAHCDHRCLTTRTLRLIADQREWKGIPSTTQLLKGTRETFLEITTDYILDPQSALFRVHGTKGHAVLDKYTGGNELGEERLFDEICSGQFDHYDPVSKTLTDSKTWGSYKVARALGIRTKKVEVQEVDDQGNVILLKSGPRKGQPKTKTVTEFIEGAKDRLDTAIQLNDYRMKLEKLFPVEHMAIEALVRDGGTWIAESRGIKLQGYLIPVNRISDHWVKIYLKAKADALHKALETNVCPKICRMRERWGGKKCESYCNVRIACDQVDAGKPVNEIDVREVCQNEYLPKAN